MTQHQQIIEQEEDITNQLVAELASAFYPAAELQHYVPLACTYVRDAARKFIFIPFFAAADIICCFLKQNSGSASFNVPEIPENLEEIRNEYHLFTGIDQQHYETNTVTELSNVRDQYQTFLKNFVTQNGLDLILRDFRYERSSNAPTLLKQERQIYMGFQNLLFDVARSCPLVSRTPLYNTGLLQSVDENAVSDMFARSSSTLARVFRLESSALRPAVPARNVAEKEKTIDISLITTRAQSHKRLAEAAFSAGNAGGVGPTGHIETQLPSLSYDPKTTALHLRHLKYEPTDRLKRKLAKLRQLDKQAVQRSPFNCEYSRQERSGTINPSFLTLGLLRLLIKMQEGHAVYLGRPDPMYQDDNITVDFYLAEDAAVLTEKITPDSSGHGCATHANIHKTLAMLLARDLALYLGSVGKMNLFINFSLYRCGPESTITRSPTLRASNLKLHPLTDTGLLTEREIQRVLLFESAEGEAAYRTFGPNFHKEYFGALKKAYEIAPAPGRHYAFFFQRGGGFLKDNDPKQTSMQMKNFFPNENLKRLYSSFEHRFLPNAPSRFVVETNHRFVLVSGATNSFPCVFIEKSFEQFLKQLREFFLDRVTDEAIQFREIYLQRMRS